MELEIMDHISKVTAVKKKHIVFYKKHHSVYECVYTVT